MHTETISNLNEMDIWASSFIKSLPNDLSQALIVGLSGDLGSGKTTFVQSVAKALKIERYITSPTFVIQKRYKISSGESVFENLIHVDAYRLEGGDELLNLNWEEIIRNPKNIIFIEWSENIKDIFSSKILTLYFKFVDEDTREISYEKK